MSYREYMEVTESMVP